MKNSAPSPPFLLLIKQFRRLTFGLFILVVFSCQEFETNLPKADIEENEIHYVDIDQAKMIASTIEFPVNQSFHKSTNQASRKSFDIEKLGAKKIKESKSPLEKTTKPFIISSIMKMEVL